MLKAVHFFRSRMMKKLVAVNTDSQEEHLRNKPKLPRDTNNPKLNEDYIGDFTELRQGKPGVQGPKSLE